ncbi:MAG: GatB/YqeY domain-containing protein [Deltaproteobacteria bacterium]|nr:GatB/YqeY domain-containing protein [Deltaproteobacteria bacterium]
MSLLVRIDTELKDAMRAKDTKKMTVLRSLKSALGYRGIELEKDGKTLGDADVIAVVGKLIKQRQDAAQQYTAGGRPELAANETQEITALEAFLPKQLTEDELKALIAEAVAEVKPKGPRDMGQVMKAAQAKIAGRADGKRVSELVKAALATISG